MRNEDKRRINGENKRILIAKVALKLFKEKGYKQVTVDEIVKQCQTSKGSFYHHYQSKSDILNEQFKIANQYYEKMLKTISPELSAGEKFELFFEKMYMYLEETFGMEFLTIIYSSSLETKSQQYFRNEKRKLYTIFEWLIADYVTEQAPHKKDSVLELKTILIQLVLGTMYAWCTFDKSMSLKDSAMPAIHYFIKAI